MGRNVVLGSGALMLGLSMLAVGCQQAVAPLNLSVASDEIARPGDVPGEQKDSPYFNSRWRDDDQQSDFVSSAMSMTGAAAGAVVNPLVDLTSQTFKWASGERASSADKLLEDKTSADNRREGMNKLANFGFLNNPLFDQRCRQIAESDQDFTVRASAIRTENRARDNQAASIFVKGLGDHNEWVRLEAAKALVNVPDINAAVPLTAMLNDPAETRDVRVAVADAMKHYRTLPVARALVSHLNDKSFIIGWQSRRSLRYLFSKDFGYDEGAWLTYFTGPEKPLG